MARLVIDTGYLRGLLAELLAIPSPAGYTDQIVRRLSSELASMGLKVELTRRGAIRTSLKGRSSRGARAIIGHVDTLGAQVKLLKDNGRLELVAIGHWSARFAEGARATIFTDKGSYRGTILPMKASGHTYNEEIDTAPIGWQHVELRVDALARGRRDLERLGFSVGDIVAIDPMPEFMENGYVVSRHLDDKAGVASIMAALKALTEAKVVPDVDVFFLFSIAEEVGVGASSIVSHDVAAMVAVDNGTVAPGQASDEFGVTVAMADMTGPFDYHLTKKLIRLCRDEDIRHQTDVFRFYRSDSASAIEAGADVRTALITFGVDASHGYERTHMHALRSVAELLTAYVTSPVEIPRDREPLGPIEGFTSQPTREADATIGI